MQDNSTFVVFKTEIRRNVSGIEDYTPLISLGKKLIKQILIPQF